MTTKQNIIEIVDAFEIYVNSNNYDDLERNDSFLRYVLDRSPTPSFQGRIRVEDTKDGEIKSMDYSDQFLTAEQEMELAQVEELMTSCRYGDETKLGFAELQANIMRFPPVYAPQLLIIAIAIFLLRCLNADFDSDTATFTEFFENWHTLIISR